MQEAEILAQLAGGRPTVALAHPRQRTTGAVGVLAGPDGALAISAHAAELRQLPELAGLRHLARLDVGDNQLARLPALPASLRELYIHDNQLAELPPLPALTVLDANRNRLARVPPLADLAFAYLAHNRLTALPAVRGVAYLNVGDNPLGRIELADPALRELRAEHAELTELALDLPALHELALRGNQLTALPDLRVPALRVLDLRGNALDELPGWLRDASLAKLDLRWNPLRRPPAWLDELTARGCLVYV